MSITPQRVAPSPFKLEFMDGTIERPWWTVVHGAPKIGKSTWAAGVSKPIFLDIDTKSYGSWHLNVRRVKGLLTWEDLLAAFQALRHEKHDGKTAVLDTLDSAEAMCHRFLCEKSKVRSIEEVGKGYGRGYTAAYEEFRRLLDLFEQLRIHRDMNVLVLAHSKVGKVPNPSGADWERWELKCHKQISGAIGETFDAILFAHQDVVAAKETDTRAKGYGNDRVLECIESPAWQAGNRLGLPERLPFTWEAFAEAMKKKEVK